ncbi:MAG: InlB B-repeat-containing protein, partial [Hungatella sp.]
GDSAPNAVSYPEGAAVPVDFKSETLPKRGGYTFLGWNPDQRASTPQYAYEVGAANEYQFTMADADVTLYAVWAAQDGIEYRVEHWLQKQGTSGTAQADFERKQFDGHDYETKSGVTDSEVYDERNQKTFSGYTYASGLIDGKQKGMVTVDPILTLQLYYTLRTDMSYQVRYLEQGTDKAVADAKKVTGQTFGTSVTEEALNVADYHLTEDDQKTQTVTLDQDGIVITFRYVKTVTTAAYQIAHYQQNLDGTGYALQETENLTGTIGATATATAKTYEGFAYNSKAAGTAASGTIAKDGSLVLKLYYDRNSYPVKYRYTGDLHPSKEPALPNEATYKFGETVAVAEIPTAVGYNFTGWYNDGGISGESFTMPAKPLEFTGMWNKNTYDYTVKFYKDMVSESNHIADARGTSAEYGTLLADLGVNTTIALNSCPNGYMADGVIDTQNSLVTIGEDAEQNVVKAVLSKRSDYSVTWKTQDGNTALEQDSDVTFNTQPSYDAKEPSKASDDTSYYTFAGWSTEPDASTGKSMNQLPLVTSNVIYYAAFAQNKKHEITVTAASKSKDYDGTALTLAEFTTTGDLIAGDSISATVTGSATAVKDTQTGNNRLPDDIRVMREGIDVTNQYKITAVNGTLTINPRSVTITVNNQTKSYGAEDPNFGGRVTGLLASENAPLGELTYRRIDADANKEHVGDQITLTADYTANSNYAVRVALGKLEIKPIHLKLRAWGGKKGYDGTPITHSTGDTEGKYYLNVENTKIPEGETLTVQHQGSQLFEGTSKMTISGA